MTKILNIGSLNADEFYTVPHITKSGETLSSSEFSVRAGGKGANQSAALSRAGGKVYHAGKVGKDSEWLRENIKNYGVNVDYIIIDPETPQGRAIIQSSAETGDNAIFLYGGTNQALTLDWAKDNVLGSKEFGSGDFLLMQNEISAGGEIMGAAADLGLGIVFNPAPMTPDLAREFPLDKVDILIVNEHEGLDLYQQVYSKDNASRVTKNEYATICKKIFDHLQSLTGIVMTLGSEGLIANFRKGNASREYNLPAHKATVKDTTAAGDTFTGFFLARYAEQCTGSAGSEAYFAAVEEALKEATVAAAICVERVGSMSSEPDIEEVKKRM
ncbi:hypothetical protein BZG36_05273 [Bifiguratus adelaidae]|uniref:Ribokinase n=1 Tax=Bifiguratus adelaidae TaxID=1938954 RepID=A0A261XU41_9FUNG|nr:hypothetical protein BZG36_05273 [Bifiguratus adelaidae]